jgi:glycosyltransferase involved in cell wall biosynthesis
MKLAVYAIAKNEIKHVDRWYECVKDADEVVVLDTGSTDGTAERLAELGARVVSTELIPFRFDTARNTALNLVSPEMDYCMFMDLDETMPEGSIGKIRELIEASNQMMYGVRLVFTFDAQRQPLVSYTREAIHTRKDFYWKYPVHELLMCHEPNYSFSELPIDVFHEPDNDKSRGSYLDLLETAVQENPNDARCVQYLGREYMYQGRYFDAIMWLKRHLEVEIHGPFRSESARYISQCYYSMGDSLENSVDEAEAWLYRACAEQNDAREPFCDLAYLYFICGEYECAIGAIRSALRVESPPNVPMIRRDELYQHWPYHMLAACYDNLGNKRQAQHNIQLAMMNAKSIDGTLAQDIAKILGLQDVSKSIASQEVPAPL